jgi:hypothetical protein
MLPKYKMFDNSHVGPESQLLKDHGAVSPVWTHHYGFIHNAVSMESNCAAQGTIETGNKTK